MPRTLYSIRHQVEGSIDFVEFAEGGIKIRVRWPFDLETGEWITLNVDVDRLALTHFIQGASKSRTDATLAGVSGDSISLSFTEEDTVVLDLIGGGFQRPTRFIQDIAQSQLRELGASLLARQD